AQLAVATFSNNGGLVRAGDTAFEASRNSGLPQIGAAGTGDRGTVTPGALEMSNVDLSAEFTSMIITQRGFQANSRIITTSDDTLQDLVNMKRWRGQAGVPGDAPGTRRLSSRRFRG